MSHPFGDLLSQYLHRKHGLSQARLAEGILQDPSVITKMCKGRRLTGIQARERVVAIISWLHGQAAIETVAEANALLSVAAMAPLRVDQPREHVLLQQLRLQVLPPRAATTLSPSVTTRRTNLPSALTSFVGRAQEFAAVEQLITTQRLVTLTGAGGVGKTRLATEVGIRLVQGIAASAFDEGVWLVELAELSRPTLVAEAIIHCFKLPEAMSQAPLELLEEYLVDKHLLLILDNCEHLVEACAEIVERLLHRCWGLHVLATSREELRVPGEAIYPVLPLTLPDPLERSPERLLASTAAQLFVERIGTGSHMQQIHREDAATIAHICRALDGIPLALELAAPLTRSMPLIELGAQLHNQMAILTNTYRTAIPRHQTMHSALVWSYRLLAPVEQQLLARVSVFVGGWTLAAAHAVCGGPATTHLLISLQQLVAKSWVLEENLNGQQRYRLLEPVRQFALAQLAVEGKADLPQDRHAVYYIAFVEAQAAKIWGAESKEGEEQLLLEHGNVRAALTWLHHGANDTRPSSSAYAEQALRLAATMADFWRMIFPREGIQWLHASLEAAHDAPIPVRQKAHRGLGWINLFMGNYASALTYFEDALALARQVDDVWALGEALRGVGNALVWQGNCVRAETYLDESLALARMARDTSGLIFSLWSLAEATYIQDDYERAAALLADSRQFVDEIGFRLGHGHVLEFLGRIARRQGDDVRARQLFVESLAFVEVGGEVWLATTALDGLAGWGAATGVPRRAACLFGAAQATRRLFNDPPRFPYVRADYARDLASARAHLDEATWNAAWSEGEAMTLEQAIAYALEEVPHA